MYKVLTLEVHGDRKAWYHKRINLLNKGETLLYADGCLEVLEPGLYEKTWVTQRLRNGVVQSQMWEH